MGLAIFEVRTQAGGAALAAILLAGTASGSIIRPEAELLETVPGAQLRVLWLVEDVSTPLFGYSLDLTQAADPEATGALTVNLTETNFFPARNLITAGGLSIDPMFAVIQANASGGVFASANAEDLGSVLPVSGVNDAMLELVLDIPEDALGVFEFLVSLPGTALSDAQGFAVGFQSMPLRIVVVPTPAVGGVFAAIGFAMLSRRRR